MRVRRIACGALAAAVLVAVLPCMESRHDPDRRRRPLEETPAVPAARNPSRTRPLPATARPAPAPARPDAAADPLRAASVLPPRPGRQIPFFDADPREGDLGDLARELLAAHRGELGLGAMPGELRVRREFGSLSGWHLRLEQVVDGVPVFGSEVSAHVAPDGRALLVAADVFPVEGATTTPAVAAEEARRVVEDLLGAVDDDEPRAPVRTKTPRLVLLPEGRGARLAWRVDARTDDESSRVFVDALEGDVVRTDDLRPAAEGTGRVFDPNPVYTRRDGSLKDGADRSSPTLAAATAVVTLPRLDGTGRLVGTWADLSPTLDAPASAALDWSGLDRDLPGFEAVMVYYHVDRLQDRLQALGLTNANAEPQRADAHALSQDQSYYDYYDDLLAFGDGGVDDGEDADVVVHEYGHAIQFDQVDDFGLTTEGAALGEGFGDFLAAALHATGDTLFDPLVASWDATSYSSANPPYLRRVDRQKRFPQDFVKEPHADGEIWSRFLWDLRALVGTDDALRVAVESHFFLSANARFLQAANAILVANVSLRAGRDDASIRALLDARGLRYSVPPASAPAEDVFEENDSASAAAPLPAGTYERLRLGDEDWYRLTVPPRRRLLATVAYDPLGVDVDVELLTAAGAVIDTSRNLDGVESVEVGAGPDGSEVLLRVHAADGGAVATGYDLTVSEAALRVLRPGRTEVLRIEAGTRHAFGVSVPADKADGKRMLRLVARGKSRRSARVALTDLRVTDPSGNVVSDFGDGRRPRGSRVRVPADAAGEWTVEVEPRAGTGGRYALAFRLRR